MNKYSPSIMKLAVLVLPFAFAGCSGSQDEGGVSTATPANKLNRPAPVDTASSPSAPQGTGTLPTGK